MTIEVRGEEQLYFQLPSWRPGVMSWVIFLVMCRSGLPINEKGEQLPHQKVTKDQWQVDTLGC